ncbi:conserved hypothetical protein [Nostocoides japonicum T1-X7]|uniref:General stress protein 17M-like domain-containing protein n=1 Tax=Nostocoides japonicum T1-X7 TaxID=1194083 RepID=A0A077LUL7_9MICO|nr:general stress protein [Tetrasphaera japonica]CCH77231.1 conserved hypothetical protein [Tetrasphaera japonica T1-X7]
MSTQPGTRGLGPNVRSALALEYPMSVGVYDKYQDAQKAVDYLSDHEFPVQNLMIVGTDLKQLERVTGRLTRGRVAAGGALSGAWLGGFVALIFAFFDSNATLVSFVSTVIFGTVFGLIWALIGYRLTGGARDFTSVTQVVATKYEVLAEHKVVARARELLTQMDPYAAAQQQIREAQEAERAAAARAAEQDQGQGSMGTDPGSTRS